MCDHIREVKSRHVGLWRRLLYAKASHSHTKRGSRPTLSCSTLGEGEASDQIRSDQRSRSELPRWTALQQPTTAVNVHKLCEHCSATKQKRTTIRAERRATTPPAPREFAVAEPGKPWGATNPRGMWSADRHRWAVRNGRGRAGRASARWSSWNSRDFTGNLARVRVGLRGQPASPPWKATGWLGWCLDGLQVYNGCWVWIL